MPPSTFVASLRPAALQEARDGRRPAAQMADDEERPVRRQPPTRAANDDIGTKDRAGRPHVDELVRLADVDEERPGRVLAQPSLGLDDVDRWDGEPAFTVGLQAMTMVGPVSPRRRVAQPGLERRRSAGQVDDDARRRRRAGSRA